MSLSLNFRRFCLVISLLGNYYFVFGTTINESDIEPVNGSFRKKRANRPFHELKHASKPGVRGIAGAFRALVFDPNNQTKTDEELIKLWEVRMSEFRDIRDEPLRDRASWATALTDLLWVRTRENFNGGSKVDLKEALDILASDWRPLEKSAGRRGFIKV